MLTPRENCCKSFFLQVKRRALNLTLEQAEAHQLKHGFRSLVEAAKPDAQTTTLRTQKTLRVGVRKMTRVEREFAAMLLAQKTHGKIVDYHFEGIRLAWGDGMLFKADFSVFADCWQRIKLIEVKGVHIWKHAIVRFKGCRAEWKDWFDFEFHQRNQDGTWHQLL
jgi:hypothetical protein